MAVDVATRSILGGVIAPTTKAVDAAAVLARMLVPEPMRPGWAESLHHAHSVIPHERLLSTDERFANAAAKPVIIPETINCDRGRVYLSETFLRACATLGVSVQLARPYTGSDKSLVERTFSSINTLFCQHVAGYTGRDTTRRGPEVAEDAVWTVAQFQELFDDWVVAGFTDRRTVSICPDLRLFIGCMSATESAGLSVFFFRVAEDTARPARWTGLGPMTLIGYVCMEQRLRLVAHSHMKALIGRCSAIVRSLMLSFRLSALGTFIPNSEGDYGAEKQEKKTPAGSAVSTVAASACEQETKS
jgi:hypothetical protein